MPARHVPMSTEGTQAQEADVLKTGSRIAALAVAAAVVAAPATAVAAKGGQGKAKSCAKTATRGYQLTGTLVSWTVDDPSTLEAEGSVTLAVTSANRHARNSGELVDQDAERKGVQVVGATYTVPAGDAYVLELGDDGAAVPSEGDRVKVKGRIALTKKRCAADGTSTADRYATPDVTRVTISDRELETT
jgi:hypothetical protein